MNQPDPIVMIIAQLAAAATTEAPPELRCYYAAVARESLRRLDADVGELKRRLAEVEARLVIESKVKSATEKRMVGPERAG